MKYLLSILSVVFISMNCKSMPLGEVGAVVEYRLISDVNDRPDYEKEHKLTVVSACFALGNTEEIDGKIYQWFKISFKRLNTEEYTSYLLMDRFPGDKVPIVARYLWQEPDFSLPVEYVHETTGQAVLPRLSLWNYGWPLGVGLSRQDIFPDKISFQGWEFSRTSLSGDGVFSLPDETRLVKLNPDLMIGFVHDHSQKTTKWQEPVKNTKDEIVDYIGSGFNLAQLSDRQSWLWQEPVYSNNIFTYFEKWPAYLYRSNYWGRAVYDDEPAIYYATAANQQTQYANTLTPEQSAKMLEQRSIRDLWQQVNNYSRLWINTIIDKRFGRGSLNIVEYDYPVWEVFWQNAWYILRNPGSTCGIVDQDVHGTWGPLVPWYNTAFGTQIPSTIYNNCYIRIAILRGAARNFGKKWGTSVYTDRDLKERSEIFRIMYNAGATYSWFWTGWPNISDGSGVASAYQKQLASTLRQEYLAKPNRDMHALLHKAKAAIVVPDGFTFHPNALQGVNWLHLERKTPEGVTYRQVLSNAAKEVERFLREGVEFDILINDDKLKTDGYEQLVYIQPDGKIKIVSEGKEMLNSSPRDFFRPDLGAEPQIQILPYRNYSPAPINITLSAEVHAGSGRLQMYESEPAVRWEIFPPDGSFIRGLGKEIRFEAKTGGEYYVRAAVADEFGRPSVAETIIKVNSNRQRHSVFPNKFKFKTDPQNIGQSEKWFGSDFDDSDWDTINVPGWWNDQGYDYEGYGWYRASVMIPEDAQGKLHIEFEGVDESVWVYVDGKLVGERSQESTGLTPAQYWDKPYLAEVKGLMPGKEYKVVFRVHNIAYNGGIYKPVFMTINSSYTSKWEISEPFTIVQKKDNEELACPGVFYLPCGDLLLGYPDDGDFAFSRSKYLRSSDGGKSWYDDTSIPVNGGGILVLDDLNVILYDIYMFAVRGSNREYIGRMVRSSDGGRTFGAIEYHSYHRPSMRNLTVRDMLQGAALPENLKYWQDVFEKAGWEEIDWLDVELLYHQPLPSSSTRLDDGRILNLFYCNSRGDGSTAGFRYWSHVFASTTTDGIRWEHLSMVTPLDESNLTDVPWWRHYAEPTVARTSDGDLLVIIRDSGNGWPLQQARSFDDGKTWTELEPVSKEKVRGILPMMHRLEDGALMMTHGRPGMFLMFDPTGTGMGWEINDRIDLWEGEALSLKNQNEVYTARKELKNYRKGAVPDIPLEDISWVRQDLLNGYFIGWENVRYVKTEPGRFLIVYDVQRLVEHLGDQPVKAIRGVWMTKSSIE